MATSLGDYLVRRKKSSRGDPSNYRPTAILCDDVKVLSSVLAHGLLRFLPKLIHQDQKAFVRERWTRQHIRHVTNIQDWVTHHGRKSMRPFSTVGKLMIDLIGRTSFAFWVKWAWKKSHRLGSSSVHQHENVVDD